MEENWSMTEIIRANALEALRDMEDDIAEKRIAQTVEQKEMEP